MSKKVKGGKGKAAVKPKADRSAAAKKAWASSREKIIAGIRRAVAAKKAAVKNGKVKG